MAAFIMLSVIGLLFIPGTTSIRWSNKIRDGQPVYACAGGSVKLPWNISKEAENEGITDIQWFFQGQDSQEMIAILAHGNFLVMPAFQGRVKHLETGGLFLSKVSVEDTGNYSIEIAGHDSNGTYYKVFHTAIVRVGDSLMTTDGNIHVFEEQQAKWDNSDGNFHVVLSCGTFTYLTYPPFEVEWTHPDGYAENSTLYTDGKFQLLLANPIKGGNYTCRIPQHSAATACLPGETPKPVVAFVNMNSLEGRLTVIEAQQAKTEVENSKLKDQLSQIQNETLEDRQIISFTAHLHSAIGTGSQNIPIILTDVVNNNGGCYNSTTGKFTVPKNGTYVFMATTYSFTTSYYANAKIMSKDTTFCTIDSRVPSEVGSCQVTVSLITGQQVWINSYYHYGGNYYSVGTSFSGFLLRAD